MNKKGWFFLAIFLGVSGIFTLTTLIPSSNSKEVKKMAGENGEKALMIIAHKDFRDEEFLEPKAVLEKNGLKVTVASSSIEQARGVLGAKYKPDLTLNDVNVEDYNIIVFVGGPGSREYWADKKAHEIAKKAVSMGKILGAICIAPVTLANAGLLNGKKATVFPSEANSLTSKGANYTGKTVEKDGLIITANGPNAATKFANALIEALGDRPGP